MQPGNYGKPLLEHDFKDQILDSLHLGRLNLPKIPYKYGILNNASDDAREQIAEYLKSIKHALDTRKKDNGRQRGDKWFTGEKWGDVRQG